jgi:hypothetical protein
MTARTGAALAVTASTVLIVGMLAPAAKADHTQSHTRQQNCEAAGGIFQSAPNQNGERCNIWTETPGVTTISGPPVVTLGDPRPVGSALVVDSPPVPDGEPIEEREVRTVGEAVVVESERLGTPTTEIEERDSGEAFEEFVIVSGTPATSERTERGTPTSVQVPGARNCERVNNGKAEKPVERCERTVVTTTTTPTTIYTTVTTPRERVTTTTQPRETVTTVTTPVTPVSTSTQQREECVTTEQRTSFVRTTTQQTERTQTTTTPRETTFTRTRTQFAFRPGTALLQPRGIPDTFLVTEAADPLVVEATVPGEPIITTETLAGDPIVTGPVCTPIEPEVIITEGETFDRVVETVTAAADDVTITRTPEEPLVVTTSRPGQPVVETSTRGTGETCTKNPSNAAQRRNACA